MLVIKCKGFHTKAELLQQPGENSDNSTYWEDVYEVVIQDHLCEYPTATLVFPWVNASGRHKRGRSTTQATGSAESTFVYHRASSEGKNATVRGSPPWERQKSRLGRNITATVQRAQTSLWSSPETSKAANSWAASSWVCSFLTQRDSNPPGWSPQQPQKPARAAALWRRNTAPYWWEPGPDSAWASLRQDTHKAACLQEAWIWTYYVMGPLLVRTVNISQPKHFPPIIMKSQGASWRGCGRGNWSLGFGLDDLQVSYKPWGPLCSWILKS